MGQKVHPTGMWLNITEKHRSMWYAKKSGQFASNLLGDLKARSFLKKELEKASVGRIQIERTAESALITIHTARPGVVIGKKGEDVERLKAACAKIMGVPVHINISEIRRPELDAQLVAEGIAQQLVKRVMIRRAMKRAVQNTMRQGAQGVKIAVSGRLGGAEIARREWTKEGRIPLHTFRADIDYGFAEALTTYGIIGVKVWIFKGEVFDQEEAEDSAASAE